MSTRQPADIKRVRKRIADIRAKIATFDYLCTGSLIGRMRLCPNPKCACATDPAARHGPYYEWRHMKGGRVVGRMVSAQQAELFRQAIANYQAVKALIREWEAETDDLIELEHPRSA